MKKYLFLLLVFAAFSGSLFSCKPSEADNLPGDASAGEKAPNGDAEPGDPYKNANGSYDPKLPDRDFGGMEFRFLVNEETEVYYYNTVDVYAETSSADPIEDSVYRRNLFLEEKYNAKITEKRLPHSTMHDYVNKAVSSGLVDFEVLWAFYADNIKLVSKKGMLADLKTISHLDLGAPWWDRNVVSGLTIKNKLYNLNGDISINGKKLIGAVFFNKKLAQDLNLENPYKLVEENKWTHSAMFEMSKEVYADLNGDGKADAEDRYGICSNYHLGTVLFFGGGGIVGKKNEDDIPVYDFLNQRNIDIMESLYDYVYDEKIAANYLLHFPGIGAYDKVRQYFAMDRYLFLFNPLNDATYLRDMDSPFGILPLPKYNEEQEWYCGTGGYISTMLSVPTSNEKLEETGFLLEAMAAESKNTLTPAFYDITLKRKIIRDEESSKMLDIIFDIGVFNVFLVYGIGETSSILPQMAETKARDMVSRYEKIEEKSKQALDNFISCFED